MAGSVCTCAGAVVTMEGLGGPAIAETSDQARVRS